MFKKTLTAAVAALTLAGATVTTTQSAQAGSLGKAVAIGIVGAAVGAIAGAVSSRSSSEEAGSRYEDRSDYRSGGFRQARGGYEGGFRQVRGGYDEGCGFRVRPVFDEYGNKVGVRNVPAC